MNASDSRTDNLGCIRFDDPSNKFPENVRIHPQSDIFDPTKNYVGLIFYSNGNVYIKESNWILKYIPQRRGRRGYYIHGRLFYSIVGTWKARNTSFVGCGFSYLNDEWKFSSGTLNTPSRELNEMERKPLQLILDTLYKNHRWLEMPPEVRIRYEHLVRMMVENQKNISKFDPSIIHPSRKLHGCVKWVNDRQCLGYIECIGLDRDFYIHSTCILHRTRPDSYTGRNVEFNVVQGPHGWKAENIITTWP
jgi:cold shock CspA family protein